jgi:hypothetical protein
MSACQPFNQPCKRAPAFEFAWSVQACNGKGFIFFQEEKQLCDLPSAVISQSLHTHYR